MAEPLSALSGAAFNGLISVREAGPRGMITLRGDLSNGALMKAATSVAGGEFPTRGACSCDGESGIAWMSPDEVLIMTPYARAVADTARLSGALAGQHSLALNVSDARTVFALEGPHIREVLAKLAPVDLAPDALAPGQMRRTRLAQVAAAFWLRDETTAEVICFRSVARYVFDLLSISARIGTSVGALSQTR